MISHRQFAIALALFSSCPSAASAADMLGDILRGAQTPWVPPPAQFEPEANITLGTRIWYSSGKYRKNLYDNPAFGSDMVSRLTYDRMTTGTGEVYGRLDTVNHAFLKGYAGLGRITDGKLKDEDFPFVGFPYSSTISDQKRGNLKYGNFDAGYRVVDTPDYAIGLFGGYHILAEHVNAYGCTQIAANPYVCQPGEFGPGEKGITQDATWQSIRLGIEGQMRLFDKFEVTAEAAWVPYTQLHATDTHYFTFGAIPERGRGNGVQLETTVGYQVTKNWSIGAGARYWYLTAKPKADFGSGDQQPEKVTSEHFGVFGQTSYKFSM